MQIKRILCPVDFSETAEAALAYAVELARVLSAEVHVVHVHQPPVYMLPDGAFTLNASYAADLATASKRSLDELVERWLAQGVRLVSVFAEGAPYQEILRIAEQGGIDLVVMGTQGRTGLSHLLLGSVAERTVRMSTVPVLTVRKKAS